MLKIKLATMERWGVNLLCIGCGLDKGVKRHLCLDCRLLEEEAPLPPMDWLYDNHEEEE
jgi:hypothetical protein